MKRLSLCMIVRDEAEMLPECLISVRGAVDEMIIVDTGSSDGTVDIALAAGAIVIHEPWRNDFAHARNVALAYATGDYVLQLDADERLAATSRTLLRTIVERADFDLGMVALHNARRRDASDSAVISGAERDGEMLRLPRLFRRTSETCYTGTIHETVGAWITAIDGKVVAVAVDVVHLGILPEVQAAKKKVERNHELLTRAIAGEPDNIVPYGYLAVTLLRLGHIDEARDIVERGWALLPKQPKHVSCQRIAMARAALAYNSGHPEVVLDTTRALAKREPLGPDLLHMKGKALEVIAQNKGPREAKQLLTEALAAQSAAIRFDGQPVIERFIDGATSFAALKRKGIVLVQLGRAQEAVAPLSESNRLRPDDQETLLALAEATIDAGDAAKGLSIIEPLLGEVPDGWLLGATAARKLGATQDAEIFLGRARMYASNGFVGAHRRARLDMMIAG